MFFISSLFYQAFSLRLRSANSNNKQQNKELLNIDNSYKNHKKTSNNKALKGPR